MTTLDLDAEALRFMEQFFRDVRARSASPAPREGVTRLGYSPEEDAVVDFIESVGQTLELETERDAAGNLWMTLPGRNRTLPAIVSGSHADSVLDGGNYDGLAGVAAALFTVLKLREKGKTLKRDFRVLVLRCEEQGLIGSTAMLGRLKPEDLKRSFVAGGQTLGELLEKHAIDPAPFMQGAPLWDLKRIACFIEAHIEQTDRLDKSLDRRVGIVTGIRGAHVHRAIRAIGRTGHAGAINFDERADAVVACARFISRLWERWQEALAKGADLVVTTGSIRTPDTAIFNKISGTCEMTLDVRSVNATDLERFSRVVDETLEEAAKETGVRFEMDPAVAIPPGIPDEKVVTRLAQAAQKLGIGVQNLVSGAGHDASNLGAAGVPFAMLFIANQNGSHNPKEAMKMADFLAAAKVLTETVEAWDD